MLSLWQATVPPLTTRFASWRVSVSSYLLWISHCSKMFILIIEKENNLAKIYNARNHIYDENFKLKLCTCAGYTYKVSAWNSHKNYDFCNTQISRETLVKQPPGSHAAVTIGDIVAIMFWQEIKFQPDRWHVIFNHLANNCCLHFRSVSMAARSTKSYSKHLEIRSEQPI